MRRTFTPLSIVLGVAVASTTWTCRADDMAPAKPVDFTRDVLPILARACFDCHGADVQERALRLDVRQVAFAGGELFGPAIIPGNAAGSPLVQFIAGEGELTMPPSGARRRGSSQIVRQSTMVFAPR